MAVADIEDGLKRANERIAETRGKLGVEIIACFTRAEQNMTGFLQDVIIKRAWQELAAIEAGTPTAEEQVLLDRRDQAVADKAGLDSSISTRKATVNSWSDLVVS